MPDRLDAFGRSGERRVGKEGRTRGCPSDLKKEDGIRYLTVTGVQTCALPILCRPLVGSRLGPGGQGSDRCPTGLTLSVSSLSTSTTCYRSGKRSPRSTEGRSTTEGRGGGVRSWSRRTRSTSFRPGGRSSSWSTERDRATTGDTPLTRGDPGGTGASCFSVRGRKWHGGIERRIPASPQWRSGPRSPTRG